MRAMNTYQFLKTECKAGVAWIGMNREKARNALNYGLLTELVSALKNADSDENVRCILLYSAIDGVFCAGADIKERKAMTDAEVKKRRVFARDCYDQMEKLEKPFIAAIDGKNMGGGCEVMGTADFIISSGRATYRYVEVPVGSVGATQRVTRFVGIQRARELLFTSRTIDAQEAWQIGLVARLLPAENFLPQVEAIVNQIATYPPVTIMATKKAIKIAWEAAPEHGVLFEQLAIDLNIARSDWRSSLQAYQGDKKKD
jgi:enoyl-CoA hydratase/carnithine racemase